MKFTNFSLFFLLIMSVCSILCVVILINENEELVDKINNLRAKNNNYTNNIKHLENNISKLKTEIIDLGPPKVLGNISSKKLIKLLKREIDAPFYIADTTYSLTSVNEAKNFNEHTKVQYSKWIPEEYDCDEFSNALYGFWNLDNNQFAFGIIWQNSHAINIMIDDNLKIWIIEPQTNKFINLKDSKNSDYDLLII